MVCFTQGPSINLTLLEYHQYCRPWCSLQRKRMSRLFHKLNHNNAFCFSLVPHLLVSFCTCNLCCFAVMFSPSPYRITLILHQCHALLYVFICDMWVLCCHSEKLNSCVCCWRISLLLALKINISFEMQIMVCTKDKKRMCIAVLPATPLLPRRMLCVPWA